MRERLGIRNVTALKPGAVVWDTMVTGFGARRQRSECITYFVFYRSNGRQRWQTIGRHGAPWTPDSARAEARRLLGAVAAGGDPAAAKQQGRKAMTVANLCDRYFADALAGNVLTRFGQPKRASTLAIDKGRIARHIVPLIGSLRVTAVTSDDIKKLRDDIAAGRTAGRFKGSHRGLARVHGGKGAATRALRLLGGMFTYAVENKLRADNPVRGVKLFADGARTRSMTDAEYRSLGTGLRRAEAENMWPAAVNATRLLALCGWRHGEVLNLTWGEVDIDRRTAMLNKTKTGASMRALSAAACEVLRNTPRFGGNLIFPSSLGGDKPMAGLKKHWYRIAKLGSLPSDISPHVLRHSFASTAASLGLSDIVIAALLGHRGRGVTSRYARAADPVLVAAADQVAAAISKMMDTAITKRARRAA